MKDNNQKFKIDEISKKISNLKNSFNSSTPIIDGIVDFGQYQTCDLKILWILKEVNSVDDIDEWDLRDAISNLKTEKGIVKGWGSTFNPIVYTTYGILNNKERKEINNINSNPEIIDVLQKIAYVNIKKIPGGSVVKHLELEMAYDEQKEILKEQISLYNPNIIICGGTFEIIKDDLNYKKLDKKHNYPINIFQSQKRIIIDAYHPNNRTVKQEIYCNSIINAVKDWKLIKPKPINSRRNIG